MQAELTGQAIKHRGGDAVGSWFHTALSGAGLGLAGLSAVAAAVAGGMAVVAWATGRGFRARGGR